MHDLFRQLACHLSKEECFVGDQESLGSDIMCKLRRITIVTGKDVLALPSVDKDQYKVRTYQTAWLEKPLLVDNSLFKKLRYLRVLDLTGSLVPSVPSYIANLVHLSLLDLDHTNISHLPETIGYLQNLQILNLQNCKSLRRLPSAITQLCNLRQLGLYGTPINYVLYGTPINYVPKGIGRLKFLNDLEGFPVGGGSDGTKMQDGWNLEELAHLSQLRQLEIVKLERGTSFSNTDSFLLTDKEHLKVLCLCCSVLTDGETTDEDVSSIEASSEEDASNDEEFSEEDARNVEKIFEQLTPPRNLEDLIIIKFIGRRFPTWISTHLSSVKLLTLINCNTCKHLPPIGQLPSLKYLKIDGTAITKIRPEFVGCMVGNLGPTGAIAFPKLERLVIKHMPNWEEWSFVEEKEEEEEVAAAATKQGSEDGASVKENREALSSRSCLLPCLMELELVDCPKLRDIPRQLGQMATSLKKVLIRDASCLKTVEDFWFLSGYLSVEECDGLERVFSLPQVRELRVNECPNLRQVEELCSLEQIWLTADMQEISSLWVPRLQEQRHQLHGDELEVNEWL